MIRTAEHDRLAAHRDRRANWKLWGPYLSERAWGTVREDYSAFGTAWAYFPHDHARSRAYRWNEDGLAGISDRHQYICFALALWNGHDPILKERLFGLSGKEGNHGEDVKEYYYYLDSTPTHSYMKMLYKYPQAAFPYDDLVEVNRQRGYYDDEYELIDTGVFDDGRYFDVFVEYAKASEDDLLIQITAHNRGPAPADLHLLPTVWFRNTWAWGYPDGPMQDVPARPGMQANGKQAIALTHPAAGSYHLYSEAPGTLLFTENETNAARLFDSENASPYVKDAFHRYLIDDEEDAVNPDQFGTRAAVVQRHRIPAGGQVRVRLRLSRNAHTEPFGDFDSVMNARLSEADTFYAAIQPATLTDDERRIQRQALAGMLWSKQLYYYDVAQWLQGDPAPPPPPTSRQNGRNRNWAHLHNFDIISMPDKWEYPWYATWDLAFHTVPLALVDPDFAKRQLVLFTREWYMHPNGQLPAYEWALDDVNPPVHAWAALRVYQIDAEQNGVPDTNFLEGIFHKLLLNFTWWTNRKDADGNNIFQGGFLGLDNISVFDRSHGLPPGTHVDQSDGTAWMGAFSATMLHIALELAQDNPVYQDIASKFFEHFLGIAYALSHRHNEDADLWDDDDQFFYDALHTPYGRQPIRVRSLVGLLPLFATNVLEPEMLEDMPDFERRLHWLLQHRPDLTGNMTSIDVPGEGARRLLAIVTRDRLLPVLRRMLDEGEFLSPYGIRSLSKAHEHDPFSMMLNGDRLSVSYWPGESRSGLFGGNSNWRGPVWFPINVLLIEALRKFHHYYGDALTVEFPTGSGEEFTLDEVADSLSERLIDLFRHSAAGTRPSFGHNPVFQHDPHWRDHLLFYEYFHGNDGRGLGASHQTGWTGLVATLLQEQGLRRG